MKQLAVGILAHVDAGKTTLCEALLCRAGVLQTPGRVDHQDAFLDTHALERQRGITIFSKQALLTAGQTRLTLLDTPGHVDFSAEMERTLQVLDYAVLVISGTDGVQAHTDTVWQLLRRYQIPTFVFITKMDLPGAGRQAVLQQLQRRLGGGCVDFSADVAPAERDEAAALCDEALLEEYLASGTLTEAALRGQIAAQRLFPCFFGSGLRLEGVEALLDALDRFTQMPVYPAEFSARVFKVSRDRQGTRLTHLKLTGGTLRSRTPIRYEAGSGESRRSYEEKINQLRLYSGEKYTTPDEIGPGSICAAVGLSATWPGQGLGAAAQAAAPVLEPVLRYRIVLPAGCDARTMLPKLQQLTEEDPQLHIVWDELLQEIHVQLMGEIQIEVLCQLVQERFDVKIQVDQGQILYKETIAAPVEGVGHFEPLRHYAEVHLLLEPGAPGSGLTLDSRCSENVLDRNWQRLILTHLAEKQHRGVLTGAPVTDLKITLMSGRAHLKHTEGGDFRQATYRAVRQGLMQAQSVLLEPVYRFRLEVPPEQLGRAINDVRAMSGSFDAPEQSGGCAVLEGTAPVATMGRYARELAAYTHGLGRLRCQVAGYAPCHNTQQVLQACGYDPEADLANTPDSVFCAHGAGFTVKWNQVPDYMHLESCLSRPAPEEPPALRRQNLNLDEKELQAIWEREFGPVRRREYRRPAPRPAPEPERTLAQPRRQHLIVDGYNVIFAWDGLKELAAQDLERAREALCDILINYHGYTKTELVVVFDAYKVAGNPGARLERGGISNVYTRQGETGDMYIEQLVNEIGKNDAVRVITSDGLIQLSALRSGVLRTSAAEFAREVEQVDEQIARLLQALRDKPARMQQLVIKPRKGDNHGA